jgi:hypothetical protein
MGDHVPAERSLRESLPIFGELRLPVYEDKVRQALRAYGPALTG